MFGTEVKDPCEQMQFARIFDFSRERILPAAGRASHGRATPGLVSCQGFSQKAKRTHVE
jgi:hypothetical protein